MANSINWSHKAKICARCKAKITTYPCRECGFKPEKPKNPLISDGYQ